MRVYSFPPGLENQPLSRHTHTDGRIPHRHRRYANESGLIMFSWQAWLPWAVMAAMANWERLDLFKLGTVHTYTHTHLCDDL